MKGNRVDISIKKVTIISLSALGILFRHHL